MRQLSAPPSAARRCSCHGPRLAPPRPAPSWSSRAGLSVVARSRKRSPVSEGLESVLRDELKIERERYRTPDAVLEGPPGGYELEDRPNSNVLLLSRSFGAEDVFVEVDLDAQQDLELEEEGREDEEDEDELDRLPAITFMVNIVKGERVLGFSCEADGDEVAITHVSLNDAPGGGGDDDGGDDEDDDELPPYTGPVFTELDDTLQQAFTDYLEERGIGSEFGAYLVELVHDKLEVEYMNWLTRVSDFVTG